MKKNTYLTLNGIASLKNGSFYRVTGRKKDAYAIYINGDFMGFTDKLPDPDEWQQWTRREAKKHLPACNQ